MNRHGAIVLNRFGERNSDQLLESRALSHKTDDSLSSNDSSNGSAYIETEPPLERKNTANFGGIKEENKSGSD